MDTRMDVRRPTRRAGLLSALALVVVASCGQAEETVLDPAGAAEIGTAKMAVVNPSSCATGIALRTFTGGGSFRRGSGYSATNCSNAYVIDMLDYAGGYGTQISYDDAIPATKAACEETFLNVGVWEKNSARTFIGETTSRGKWVVDPANQGICRLPRVLLEQKFRAYRGDGRDYKIAIRVQNADGNQKRIAFSTNTALPPTDIYLGNTLRNEIDDLPAGAIHPVLHTVWQIKGTPQAAMVCRAAQLDLTLMRFSSRSLTQLGVPAADVNGRINSYQAMRDALCLTGSGRTEAAFQTAAYDFFGFINNIMGAQSGTFWEPPVALEYPDHLGFQTMLMGKVFEHDLGTLFANCNVSPTDLHNFVVSGVRPNNVPEDRVLLGSCANRTAAQVASDKGVGGNRSVSGTQDALLQCLIPEGRDVCNDPRAQTAQTDGEAPYDPEDDCSLVNGEIVCEVVIHADPECFDTADGVACEELEILGATDQVIRLSEQREAIKAKAEQEGVNEGGNRAQVQAQVSQQVSHKPDDLANVLWDLNKFGIGIFIAKAAASVGAAITGVFSVSLISIDFGFKQGYYNPDNWDCSLDAINRPFGLCEFIPHRPQPSGGGSGGGGQQYCGADFAPGGWYGSSASRFTTGAPPTQLTEADRINHCLCKAIDARYAVDGAGTAIASAMCPDPKEELAQDCLANPFGPNGGPRPECVVLMQPVRIDDDVWRDRICSQIQCPSGKIGATNSNDGCSCIDPPRVLGSGTPGCPIGTLANCAFDNPNTCLCTPLDYGDRPYGNNPICRHDRNSYPGPLEGWTIPNRDLVSVARIGNENFVMFETGRATQVSAVTPTLHRNSFVEIGTTIRPRTFISRARTDSGNIDLQLFCNNPAQNLFRQPMGQCRLNDQPPNVASNCEITLNSNVRDQCMTGAFTFEWTMQTPLSYLGAVGVGPSDFGGTLTRTPDALLFDLCPPPAVTPPPSPTNPRPIYPYTSQSQPLPLWEALGGTPRNPEVILQLGGGGSVRPIPTVDRLIYIDQFAR